MMSETTGNPNLENIDAVATALGLEAWQLLAENLGRQDQTTSQNHTAAPVVGSPLSPTAARLVTAPFHRMVFIESKRRHVEALRRLATASPGREITVLHQDANAALPECIAALSTKLDRAIVFLDPYGMSVDWLTLKALADSKVADVWYLFPLSGLYRQAARDAADIDADKAAAITRMMGTEDWRPDLYAKKKQQSLFDADDSDERIAGPQEMTDWVTGRLNSIFPAVVPPKVLYQTMPSGAPGAPLFALYFAVSNDSPKAVGLATKIATDILRGRS